MKPAGRGFSTRPRGVRRECIHDPRSMHVAVGVGRERCINSGGGRGGIRTDQGGSPGTPYERAGVESPRIDGIATPVHTEGYE